MIGNTNSKSNVKPLTLVTWGGGSAEEIAVMLDEHYAGLINIADYWVVGDTRTESITATSGGTSENQSAQSIDLVILGMNHDDLADGSGNAAVTVQTKNTLSTAGYMTSGYNGAGYSLWSNSLRRIWCNNNFKSALPDWLQNLIKPVTKITNRYGYVGYTSYRGQTTTTDEVFLLSEYETWGYQRMSSGDYGSIGSDGKLYEYMKTTANRSKRGGSTKWWLRTGIVGDHAFSYFFLVMSDGNYASGTPENTFGIAPAFCL